VTLDLLADPVSLTAALAVQAPHLEVVRSGQAVLARTHLGRRRRVLLAGHLDTVPIADNVPSRRKGTRLHGCGTSDMKSGVAVMTHLAAAVAEPAHDVTLVLYDCEEVEAARNGLGRIERELREWLDADLAILGEPTSGQVEGGCQGTLRMVATLEGRRAHSARAWLGDNAVHAAASLLARLAAYVPRDVDIDGCVYREGLQAVRIDGGVAGNVVPDRCTVTVNFRFAPDRDLPGAEAHVHEVLDGTGIAELVLTDAAPGALPGLAAPAAAEFVAATGATPVAKYGWTDVARFAALGIPALNFGPGDPNLAHTREESVEVPAVTATCDVLRAYLTAG